MLMVTVSPRCKVSAMRLGRLWLLVCWEYMFSIRFDCSAQHKLKLPAPADLLLAASGLLDLLEDVPERPVFLRLPRALTGTRGCTGFEGSENAEAGRGGSLQDCICIVCHVFAWYVPQAPQMSQPSAVHTKWPV